MVPAATRPLKKSGVRGSAEFLSLHSCTYVFYMEAFAFGLTLVIVYVYIYIYIYMYKLHDLGSFMCYISHCKQDTMLFSRTHLSIMHVTLSGFA